MATFTQTKSPSFVSSFVEIHIPAPWWAHLGWVSKILTGNLSDFPMKIQGCSCNLSLKPIKWMSKIIKIWNLPKIMALLQVRSGGFCQSTTTHRGLWTALHAEPGRRPPWRHPGHVLGSTTGASGHLVGKPWEIHRKMVIYWDLFIDIDILVGALEHGFYFSMYWD